MTTGMPRRWTVADVMTAHVHVASPATPFKQLVRLIEENRISAVPVVDQSGTPIGVVSEADLLLKERRRELDEASDIVHLRRRRIERAKAGGLVASDLMSSPAITVRADATLSDAARAIQQRNVRRLVVVDARGKITGIVSRRDLLQVFLRTDAEICAEITESIVPALLIELGRPIGVDVSYSVVTLTGTLDRRSDVDILVRRVRDMDGVVDVVNRLTYAWDDTAPVPLLPMGPAAF